MRDWNVIVTIYQQGYRRALEALQGIGPTERTPYYNVLVMKADDPLAALEAIERLTDERPALFDAIGRVAPASRNFQFDSAEGFREQARFSLLELLPRLIGKSFHTRLHRRGPKAEMHAADIERFLNDALVEAATEAGSSAQISFTDPDAVIVIDTVDDRAGFAMWTREDMARHPLLRPD